MVITTFFVLAPADALPISYNYGANHGIRVGLANTFPGQTDCHSHVIIVIKSVFLHRKPERVKVSFISFISASVIGKSGNLEPPP